MATNRPRQIVATPNAQLSVLPAAIPSLGSLGYKTYTVGPDGVRFWLLLFKEDGELHCLMEAEHIGLIRTGGASGIATKYMSREDSKVAGILGTGLRLPASSKPSARCARSRRCWPTAAPRKSCSNSARA